MALTLTQIQAASNDYAEKMDGDIFFKGSVFMYLLLGSGKLVDDAVIPGLDTVDGGTKIRVPLEYDDAHNGSYDKSTVIPSSAVAIVNAARFDWAAYYAANAIAMDERLATDGDMAIASMVKTKYDNIIKTLKNAMGAALFGTATTLGKDMIGLGNLFDTTTSTAYGGIKEADMAKWAAKVVTTSEDISMKAMQSIRAAAKVNNGANGVPNLYIGTQAMKDGFERTLQTQARYADSALVRAGFDNILFGGKPFAVDDNQTAGYVDGINLAHMKLRTHRDLAFTRPEWKATIEQPDNWVANARWAGQLITSHRASHARHTNLSEPS